jgi:exosortase/archaeosortase family protein
LAQSKSTKGGKRADRAPSGSASAAKGKRKAPASKGGRPAAPTGGFRAWYRAKHPIFRFVVLLAILMAIANVLLATNRVRNGIIPEYLQGWAHISGAVLRVFGEDARVIGSSVTSSRFSVDIKRGCDAVQPTVLFISAVLASPVAFLPKLPGLAIGFFFLMAMNLVRVLSLFYIGIYFPSAFATMHHDVWQATFIILSILAWALWAIWAVRKTTQAVEAAA